MRRLRGTAFVIALASIFCLTAFAGVRAADAPQTMFVIDGSGSMWGRFETDKRSKIDVVRELLKAKIEAAGTQPVGLASFGHRRKADCTDVEIVAGPTPERGAVLSTLEKLNPRGKGPLVAGLRAAAAAVGKTRPASLIVINDGIDNCQQDACAAATEIAAAIPDVPIHIISIGIEAAELPRVQCIAKATGGTFADVTDSIGLLAAIDAATRLAMLAPDGSSPAPAPNAAAPPPPPTATGAVLQATVALAEGGAAAAVPVRWRITKANSPDPVSESPVSESDGASAAIRLDPGSYDVEAEIGRIRVKKTVTLEAGRTTGIILPLNAGRLKVAIKADKAVPAPASSSLVVTIEPVIDGKPQPELSLIERQATASQIVSPGTYNVSIADGSVRQTKQISVSAGADTAVEFTLGTGRVELSAGLREDGGAIEDVTYIISEDDPDSADGRREVARSRAPTASFTLPAGTYYATARAGDGEVRQRLAVGPGDTLKRALILPLVPVKVSALIGGQPATARDGIVYRVTALDGERREITRSVLPDLALSLLPGRYRIAAQLDAHHLKAAEEVAIETGKSSTVVLKFDAGEISLKAGATAVSNPADTYWEIFDATGKPVWRAMMREAKALLAPGRYTVRLDEGDKRTEAVFEVRSGERKVVQVGQN